LVRYSAATHALNNDLRKIPLSLVPQGDPAERRYMVKVSGGGLYSRTGVLDIVYVKRGGAGGG